MPDMRLLDDDRKKLCLQTMISMIEEKLSKSFQMQAIWDIRLMMKKLWKIFKMTPLPADL